MPPRQSGSTLALMLCMLVIMMASLQTLHEQLVGHAIGEHCELCSTAADAGGLIPLAISLPTLILDHTPEPLAPLLPSHGELRAIPQNRGPPTAN
ncbi:DUF2946 family protein [Thalassolituus sp.]|jgi:hypothetical protein|uniref:DUF2946 family protein n=1 Tax=Thalassolituus sp. TaxID=2030822 RepID=UPI001B5AA670|nr:DUF2946 family protein [Thalassolituus sp.]MBQ0780810.1 hypothetical protein [Thalassolituus oleivorans]|tara:strand:+ start:303 stop:587 length:285 start_codon:yes stop_codon:yes gene_type:complete